MRKFIKALSVLLAITLTTISMSTSVSATSKNEVVIATKDNAGQILLDQGLNANFVRFLKDEDKLDFAESILINPDLVKTTQTVSQIDELANIEKIVNSSDSELNKIGMPQESILKARDYFHSLSAMSDEELMKKFLRSSEEIKLLRMALIPSDSYSEKKLSSNQVSSSGNLGTNKLVFSTTVGDNTRIKCKEACYRVVNYYEWIESPFWVLTDTVGLAWGQNLSSKDFDAEFYYAPNIQDQFNENVRYNELPINWEAVRVPNAGLKFNMDITMDYNCTCGFLYSTLYKLTLIHDNAELQCQYVHKRYGTWGGDITISWPPGITFGIGYDGSNKTEDNLLV